MKKIMVTTALVLLAIVLSALNPREATARPEYLKQFQAHYKDSKVLDPVKEKRCFTCHYGKTKKNRNDYGQALSKHLTKEVRAQLRKDKPKFNAKISEALKLVEKKKSESGELFGKLIEAGKLPGTAPEDAEE